MTSSQEVAVVFRKGTSLLIPPFEVAKEIRQSGETFESAALRLTTEFGIVGSIDYALTPSKVEGGSFARSYMVHSRDGELDRSEFLIQHTDAINHIEAHAYLSPTERELLRCAHRLLATARH